MNEYQSVKIIIGSIDYKLDLTINEEGLYELPNGVSIYVERNISQKLEKKYKICYNIKKLLVSSFPITIRTKKDGDKKENWL